MVQSLPLGGNTPSTGDLPMRRLNRLPIFAAIALVVLFLAVIIYGLSTRGLELGRSQNPGLATSTSASTFAERMKEGVADGIIGETGQSEPPVLARETEETKRLPKADATGAPSPEQDVRPTAKEEDWLERLERERKEQYLRERNRQQLQRLQAASAARDSPMTIDLTQLDVEGMPPSPTSMEASGAENRASDLYALAMRAGLTGQGGDPNMQAGKHDFFNQDIKELGYLPNQVVPPRSDFELKRGSVIPATLITGINSDLPGRISAQVSQNVYDSASGRNLLIPQGAKLLGRYDSNVSFGQSRLLVVWTDITFPNGATLQIGGMAGTDASGFGGYRDQVNRHYFRTFASAALIAIIGAGVDMSLPDGSNRNDNNSATDAARRSFAETFGRVAERSIGKNLDVQPTLTIRPGYRFNVLVDQDIVFPASYRQ